MTLMDNQEFDAISTGNYFILEGFKDSISANTKVGYSIINIDNKTTDEIKSEVDKIMTDNMPSGYSSYGIAWNRANVLSKEKINHKIVYGVYGVTTVAYPAYDSSIDKNTVAAVFDEYNTELVENAGRAAAATLTLTIDDMESPIQFYINDDFYSFMIDIPASGVNTVAIDSNGITYNGVLNRNVVVDDYHAPILKNGKNTLRFSKKNIKHFNLIYNVIY